MTDAYAHHPELRDKITDPDSSFFRRLDLGALARMMDEQGLEKDWWYPDEVREASRAAFLAPRRGRDLWVFAYGSLMTDPGFHFAEVRRALLPGHARRFILYDTHGGRGRPEAPGLMAALDADPGGPGCAGLAFRIEAARLEEETERLWQREMVAPCYEAAILPALVGGTRTPVLTFVADHEAEMIRADLTRDEQVRLIATGRGFLGTSIEYLERIARQFDALGIHDAGVSGLLAEVHAWQAGRTTA